MIDALTRGASADSAGLLNALGSTLVSQGTEDNVAAAYASGDQGALTRAVGFAAVEATINVGVTLFGGAIAGAVVGRVFGKVGGAVLPKTPARVIAGEGPLNTQGQPWKSHVYVTAAEDIAGLSAKQIASRLAITPAESYTVIQFSSRNVAASSIVKYGLTDGGAREFVIPNGPIPYDAIWSIVK